MVQQASFALKVWLSHTFTPEQEDQLCVLNDLLKSPLISLQNGTSVEKVLRSIVTHKTEDDYD